jgi:hypothetical protein
MSTTAITLTCAQSGTSYTTNLNSALAALDTCHSGATAPTNELAQGKFWLDTSSGDMVLKIYDGTSWLPMLDLDGGVMKAEKALTADTLTTARTVTLAGGASGSFSYDGSANSTLTMAVAGNAAQAFSASTVTATTVNATTSTVTTANATTVNASTVDLGNWTVTEVTGTLFFATGGVNKMKLDASGNLTCVGDVTGFGTI